MHIDTETHLMFQFETYMNQIANVKWDSQEMPMEHNQYVNDLIKVQKKIIWKKKSLISSSEEDDLHISLLFFKGVSYILFEDGRYRHTVTEAEENRLGGTTKK